MGCTVRIVTAERLLWMQHGFSEKEREREREREREEPPDGDAIERPAGRSVGRGLSRRGLPDDTAGKRKKERERLRRRGWSGGTNERTNGRTNERTNERTVEPWSCYGAGKRRKRPVRLISAAGADKAFVHSPTTADRPLGARARIASMCWPGKRGKNRTTEIDR
ncbi:hypothetical protein ALC60_12269 [Trachymyrmex zeteki]|uniref:Uncharacterized protein n=1 Tax=Mycetomoellerius zeteki TaxID=64791 RepID=A0A151WLP8_9HYME|nr:hypothetical protein ALC60_12269 [Trachymyrmex zeteki]